MLVLGIDSSTQSTKALLVDADTGSVVEERRAPHPDGTEVDPRHWLDALAATTDDLLERADAVAVGGQQHGMVALDARNEVVRDALLWNDTRSAPQALQLTRELGGPAEAARRTGSVPVASITSTKLRWMAEHEPHNAARTYRVLLPHDYLTRALGADDGLFVTDRGDASGTGYFDPVADDWAPDLAELAIGHPLELPTIARPSASVGHTRTGAVIAAGTGDNMAAALGLALRPGDVSLSIGTSGVAAMVSPVPTADATGLVTGFADATGNFLPLVATINAAKILDTAARLLGVDHEALADLALAADPGARGLTMLPYLDGERTPSRPDATGQLIGLTSRTTREDLARAAVEALLCSLADAIGFLESATGVPARRVILIGGGARSRAVRAIAPAILGRPVEVPPPSEFVAIGAAKQAAWALTGHAEPPAWTLPGTVVHEAEPTPAVLEQYRTLRGSVG